ncbi:hypothetical protein Q604_UNBC12138G0001, partial [human gut metagenome]
MMWFILIKTSLTISQVGSMAILWNLIIPAVLSLFSVCKLNVNNIYLILISLFSFLLIKDLKCCLINVLSLLFFEKLQTKNFDLRKLKFEKSLL